MPCYLYLNFGEMMFAFLWNNLYVSEMLDEEDSK